MYTNTNGTMDKCPGYNVSLLVRCPDFRGLNVCTLIQMGPWTSVLVINVSLLVRCQFQGSKCVYTNTNGTMDKCPDYQGVLISGV